MEKQFNPFTTAFQQSFLNKILLTCEKKAFLSEPNCLWIPLKSTTLDFTKYFSLQQSFGNRLNFNKTFKSY